MKRSPITALVAWAHRRASRIRGWAITLNGMLLAVAGFLAASGGAVTVVAVTGVSLPTYAVAAMATPEHHRMSHRYWHDERKTGNEGDQDNDDEDDEDDDTAASKHGNNRQCVRLVFAEAAASAWDDGRTVGTQLQLQNLGRCKVKSLRVTRIAVDGGAYQGPGALPLALGKIDPDEDVIFDAILRLAPIDGTPHRLTLEGTYIVRHQPHRFSLQQAISPSMLPPGPFSSVPGQAVKTAPGLATYPPVPPPATFGPNAETPMFIPIGPQRQIFPPTPTGTSVGPSTGSGSVLITRNTAMANAGVPPDPNAAAAAPDGVVLSTYNSGISVSTNGGVSFTDINLFAAQPGNPARTSFFPQSDGGLCCDQVVVYLPAQNLFVWLLQYQPVLNAAGTAITSPDRLRIAWATPAAIAADFYNAWTYADLTGNSVAGVSDGLGVAANEWLDYPDLAWSDRFLYVGVDHGFPTPGSVYTGRRIVARMSLADMANTAASTIHYDRAELTGSNGLNKTHFVQGAPGRMVVGSLDNSSTLRVFSWTDGSATIPSPSTMAVSSIAQGANYTSVAPDGADWLAVSFPGNITGGVYRRVGIGLNAGTRDEYLFTFDAGTNAGGGRPRAYVRMETLTPTSAGGTDYTPFAEYDIWNTDYAYAMAAMGGDGNEIGITLAVGGGTIGYPQEAVGYRNDFVVYQVTSSNATQTVRFGDYFSTRLIPGSGLFFGTEVYDVLLNPLPPGVPSGTCATVGCTVRMRYVQFGRPPVIIN